MRFNSRKNEVESFWSKPNNMKKHFLLSLFAFSISGAILAQSSDYRWGIGVHPTAYSFSALDNGFFKPQEYQGGVSFSAFRRMGSSFDLGAELGLGQVKHPEIVRQFDNGLRARDFDAFYQTNLSLHYKFDNGYILKKDAILSPFLKTGFGGNSYSNLNNWSAFVPAGAGVNIRLDKIAASVVLQSAYNIGISAPNYLQHSLGFNINFAHNKIKSDLNAKASSDRDYDGVSDENDNCPDIFGTSRAKGCPDSDGDGMKDTEDKCPDQAGYSNLLGCLDSDYDGVIDPNDECPNIYGEQSNGCPVAKALDSDNDGTPDDKDDCPTVAGFFTAKGCPDRDGDGIKDELDACPDEYGIADFKGCPMSADEMARWRRNLDAARNNGNGIAFGQNTGGNTSNNAGNEKTLAEVDKNLPDEEYCKRVSMVDLGKGYFNVGQAQVQKTSYTAISDVIDVMKRCANYTLTVSGHADADGPEAFNQKLSERRAEAVKKYIMQNGISAERLKTNAFGEAKPAAPNDNSANKQKNRRVEFEMNRGQ